MHIAFSIATTLLVGTSAWAQSHGSSATTATISDSASTPRVESHRYWAYHLGLRWAGADANASAVGRGEVEVLLNRLIHLAPRDWLPSEMVYRLEQCEAAGRSGLGLYAGLCGPTGGLLHDLIYGITFIPSDRVRAAHLPRSGARMVVDCNGRHLQIRANLPWEQQLALIRNALSQAADAVLGSTLEDAQSVGRDSTAGESGNASCEIDPAPWVTRLTSGGVLSMTTSVLTYRLGESASVSERTFRRRRRASTWDFLQASDGRYYVAAHVHGDIPREYVSDDCFRDHYGPGAPRPRTSSSLDTITALRALADEFAERSDVSLWDLMGVEGALNDAIIASYPDTLALRNASNTARRRLEEQCPRCPTSAGMGGISALFATPDIIKESLPGCAGCRVLAEEAMELAAAHMRAVAPDEDRLHDAMYEINCMGPGFFYDRETASPACVELDRQLNQLYYGTDVSPFRRDRTAP